MVKKVLFCLSFFTFLSFASDRGDLIVKVVNMRNNNGVVRVSLFTSEKGFPSGYEYAHKAQTVEIKLDTLQIVFSDVKFGRYAVAVVHDENENNKVDTNFFGVPREGFAVSNNVEPKIRAPRFQEAVFKFNQSSSPLVLRLIYF